MAWRATIGGGRRDGSKLMGFALLLGFWATSLAAQQGRETAGWHVVRPGEDLEAVARRYRAQSVSEEGASGEREAPSSR
ncbi:MAG: hypothetical protein KDD47_17465, partial [Acidobacteria bacterium]|nr:hypothetical protein [Acidobacteriota bacterium]